jgi:flagellar hook protein FlgE
MGLTTSLYTGLTGLNVSSQMLTVAGNNIANVNTTAFKRSRANFETQISQTLSNGSAPSGELGGTNPSQIGLGVLLASVQRDFGGGSLQPTGVNTDMAIEGNGFFIVKADGSTRYTRAGNFSLDRDFNMVSAGGGLVQGFGVDSDFNLIDGVLTDVNIPVGVLTLAEATNEVKFAGNLNAGGDVATQGTIITTETLYSDNTATTEADENTSLTSLYDADGDALFADGDIVTITGATRGGATLPDKTFQVGAANTTESDDYGDTMQDLMDFLDAILGVDDSISGGVTMAAGVLTIEGNTGTANALELEDGNFIINQATTPTLPISFTADQAADGESVRTTFVVYDSLGNDVVVDLSVVLEEKSSTGTTWRFYAQSEDDSDLDRAVSTGVLTFDTDGKLLSVTDGSITIDRAGTGAFSPQSVSLGFSDQFGSVSALADVRSQVSAISQDGSPIGTLEDFSVGEDGTITGVFSNSLLRTLGRIPVAMFANNNGLEEMGSNLFRATVNSGIATVVSPGSGGSGRVVGRALELSNVELADEFVNLISASTGFSAASRVVTTSDRLIQELLNTVR